ncbi:MAG: aminomethyl-transferring glycine dehydrogenase subunit GcvPB [Thermoplasmata archaeon]|jgi:glycine dehydrogenase subunit 2|nr:glycine dehydrogenase subunit 2 [Thermoplasmatales archaeon]PMP75786.1 MAG: glycine dehydrogenase (aminomethyl-transferring) [Aciduliprofundum sp.]HEU13118.1 glycine dehydrogenase subunit 2 [Euryarchaeota archaeon]
MFHQAVWDEKLIIEMKGSRTIKIPNEDKILNLNIPAELLRDKLNINDNEEYAVLRHYVRLSQMNYGVDLNTYPLGSCTMKFNPKLSEEIVSMDQVRNIHPYQDQSTVQGALQIMYELQEYLKVIGGMDAVTLQPVAGADGEFTGLLLVRAYHEYRKDNKRTEIIVPDSAHGTNPASSTMAGYTTIEIPSDKNGLVDLDALKEALSDRTAAFMITNPNTLGIFDDNILEIARLVHEKGALLYYDGANLNGIMGITTPGKMGFDIVHFNLHKTFATPHGGGGPGAGPVGVKKHLEQFLPVPVVRYDGKSYYLDYEIKNTIGKVAGFYGNFAVLVRAWAYIKMQGGNGLRHVTERAVLNTNYIRKRLKGHYDLPYKELRKHEVVFSGSNLKKYGVRTLDVAKRMLDYGVHAPTIYFPLIVEEALMIEPTETESKDSLDRLADVMIRIAQEAKEDPEKLKNAPFNTAVKRIDEVEAARNPVLTWKMIK